MKAVKHGRSFLRITITIAALLLAASSLAQGIEVTFHWSPSPTVSPQGDVLSPAVSYDVYHMRDGGSPLLVATVQDTTVALMMQMGVRHRIRVCGVDSAGRTSAPSDWSEEVYFAVPQSGESVPPAPGLRPNFPNPFNPETNIVYGVPENLNESQPISLEIYNLRGERIRRLEADRSPGWHTVLWDGKDDQGRVMPTGPYMTVFRCNGQSTAGKMTMVK